MADFSIRLSIDGVDRVSMVPVPKGCNVSDIDIDTNDMLKAGQLMRAVSMALQESYFAIAAELSPEYDPSAAGAPNDTMVEAAAEILTEAQS